MEKTSRRKALLIVYALLTAIGVFCAVYKLLTVQTSMQLAVAIATLVLYALVMFHVAFTHKKPNSRFFSYIMLAFAFSLMFDLNFCISLKAKHFFIAASIAMLLIAYIAGRIDKINENKILCSVVSLLMAYLWFNTSKNAHTSFGIVNTSASQFFLWVNICLVYTASLIGQSENNATAK